MVAPINGRCIFIFVRGETLSLTKGIPFHSMRPGELVSARKKRMVRARLAEDGKGEVSRDKTKAKSKGQGFRCRPEGPMRAEKRNGAGD